MSKLLKTLLLGVAASFIAGAAHAADCMPTKDKDDFEPADATELYNCLKESMGKRYTKGDNAWAKEYRNWKVAQIAPAATGTHGNRFLYTFVNETGFEEYTKYSEERGAMPVGTIIAKESFNINKKGKGVVGPLFFMEKVAAGGDADNYGNWVYSGVTPGGKPLKITQKFCHDCHGAFDTQDSLGYPGEDVRLSSN